MTDLISTQLLHELAGETSYLRGVEYFDEGRVKSLQEHEGTMSANVRGSLSYRVELWAKDEEMGYSCTCPFYRDTEAFCKHCVAVGLAFLEQVNRREGGGARKPSKSGRDLTAKDIRAVLLTQGKENLADLLLRHAEENDRLRGQLMMMASKSGKKSISTRSRARSTRRCHGKVSSITSRCMNTLKGSGM